MEAGQQGERRARRRSLRAAAIQTDAQRMAELTRKA